jgi:hypothetical protein
MAGLDWSFVLCGAREPDTVSHRDHATISTAPYCHLDHHRPWLLVAGCSPLLLAASRLASSPPPRPWLFDLCAVARHDSGISRWPAWVFVPGLYTPSSYFPPTRHRRGHGWRPAGRLELCLATTGTARSRSTPIASQQHKRHMLPAACTDTPIVRLFCAV